MAASVLKGEGWNISEDAYQRCMEKTNNKSEVTNVLLHTDIKDVAVAGLPSDFIKSKPTKLCGPLVLQIQKIRNISAPTTRQESSTAPRMFRFSLSDGLQTISAIELESLHNVGFGTAPGSKVLVKGTAQVNQGIALLTNGNCKLLGGKVEVMYERWKLNKDLMKLSGNTNRPDGPPPFVPFGQKVKKEQIQNLTGKFNSLEVASAKPAVVERDNAEFDAQRQAVITEALQHQQKKSYGGIKQVDALAPLEKAEFKKPERKPKKSTIDDKDPNVSDDEEYGRGRGRKGRRGRNSEDADGYLVAGKPSAANTLFDFLGERFAGDEEASASKSTSGSAAPPNRHSNDKGFHSESSSKRGDNRQNRDFQGQSSSDSRHQSHVSSQHSSRTERTTHTTNYDRGPQATNRYGGAHPYGSNNGSQAVNKGKDDRNNYDSSFRNKRGNNSSSATFQKREDHFQNSSNKGNNSHFSALQVDNSRSAAPKGNNSHFSTQRRDPRKEVTDVKSLSSSAAKHQKGKESTKYESSKSSTKQDGERFVGKMYSDDVRCSVPASNSQASAPSRQQSSAQNRGNSANPTLACNPGDIVLAKYWEDGQFYRFQVSAPLSSSFVRGVFLDYGNTEEVNVCDLKPLGGGQRQATTASHRQQQRPSTASHRQQQRPSTASDRQQQRPNTASDRQQQRPSTASHETSEYEGEYRRGLSLSSRSVR